MIISLNKYFVLRANSALSFYSWVSGTRKLAKAAAFYPFIFTSDKFYDLSETRQKAIINHEKIHFAQQIELLFIGFIIINILERFYWLVKTRNNFESYLLTSSEQEAYVHMQDYDYLNKRERFTHLTTYMKTKPFTSERFNDYLKSK